MEALLTSDPISPIIKFEKRLRNVESEAAPPVLMTDLLVKGASIYGGAIPKAIHAPSYRVDALRQHGT